MSSNLDHRPASFRQRFAGGHLRARDVLSIVLAGTAACALALFGLDALLVGHPVQAEARAPVTAPADAYTLRDLGPYVGNWVSDRGTRLIVAKSGAVWADKGGLIGSARLDGGDHARLLFEGASFRCSYRIAADRSSEHPDASKTEALMWTLTDATPGTTCPQGRYSRHFTF